MNSSKPSHFVIGTVTDSHTPIRGAVVEVVDRDLRREELLGRTKTDRQGRYEVDYSDHQFRRAEKERADVIVRVLSDDGEVVVASKTFFNAARELTVNLKVPATVGPPEYDRYVATLVPLLEKLSIAELDDDDIAFLTNETLISSRRLGFLALADEWCKRTQVAAPVFYALLRRDLPGDLAALLATSTEQKRQALKEAVARNIVSDDVLCDLDDLLTQLEQLASSPKLGGTPVGALADGASLSAPSREEFVRFALRAGVDDDLWATLRKDSKLSDDEVAALQFANDIAGVAASSVPVVRVLQKVRTDKQWTRASDVASLQLDDWRGVATAIGSNHPDEDAAALLSRAETTYPGPTIRFAAMDGRVKVSDATSSYLAQHPDHDPLTPPPVKAPPEVRKDLGTLRRLSLVTRPEGRVPIVAALEGQGYTSATDITRRGRRGFVEDVVDTVGEDAGMVYTLAAGRRDEVEAIGLSVLDLFGPDVIDFIPRFPRPDGDDPSPPPPPPEPGDTPDWRDLVGRRTSCSCHHCRSLLSPAVYFVDLMNMLDEVPLVRGASDAQTAFLNKRPDLEYVLLDCANATTPLPYIDLVIERLEDAVLERRPTMAPPPASTPEAWATFIHEFQTHSEDGAELRAQPEHEAHPEPAAPYRVDRWRAWKLLAESWIPWTLPYDPFVRKSALLAEHLGVDLAEIQALFGADRDALTRARLELWTMWELVTTAAAPDRIWGADFGDLGDVGGVPTFLARARLTMPELERLLGTVYLDGAVTLSPDPEDPCDIERARLDGLIPELDRIQRFLRLAHVLDTNIEALDETLLALGASDIDADALAMLAGARRAASRLRTSTAVVAGLDLDGLASLLRMSATDLDELVALTERTPFDPSLGADRFAELEGLLDDVALLDSHRLSAGELQFVLTDQDRTPATFALAEDALTAFARTAHAALAGDDPVAALAEALSPLLGIAAPSVALLGQTLPHPSDPARNVFDVLGDLGSAEAFDDLDAAQLALAYRAAQLLDRASTIVGAARLQPAQLQAWLDLESSTPLLDLRQLPVGTGTTVAFAAWRSFASAHAASSRLPGRDSDVLATIALAAAADATTDAAIDHLAATTGWDRAVLHDLHAAFGLVLADYQSERAYDVLATAMRWIQRFETTPATLARWGDPTTAPHALAESLESVAAARHRDERDWWTVLTPINDQLREEKRDALVAWLTREREVDVNELYGELLLDTQMSSCALTSRLKQANAAIQLFVQRLAMNLDDEFKLPVGTSFEDWEWMKYYRLWEANRKVFLFPENWTEPELRDDKSVFFHQLEQELLQDEPDDEVVAGALHRYLERLHSVSRLDVRGIFQSETTLHVVARSYDEPHEYFYRSRDLSTWVWSAWESLDIGIRGDHVFPVEFEGRLLVIWGEAQRETIDGHNLSVLQLKWVERRQRGWSTPRSPGGGITRAEGHDWSQVDLRVVIDDDGLLVQVMVPAPLDGPEQPMVLWAVLALRFDVCTGEFRPDLPTFDATPLAAIPPRTVMQGLGLEEVPGEEGPLFVLGRNDAVGLFDRNLDIAALQASYRGFAFLCAIIAAPLAEAERFRSLRGAFEFGIRSRYMLRATPGRFRLTPEVQERDFRAEHSFALDIERRTYISRPLGSLDEAWPGGFFRSRLETFYHPHACELAAAVTRDSAAVYAPEVRSFVPDPEFVFGARYQPSAPVIETPHPTLELQFDLDQAYAGYNWEVFFHIPMLIASRLSASGRYEDAQRWLHFIFDPTKATVTGGAADCWQFPPFHDIASAPPQTLDELLELIASGAESAQVTVMRKDPFNPHAIARLRRVAYMKDVVMAYLDNLIAWADSLFARDTIETLNEATQLYVLAAEILGQPDLEMPARDDDALTWRQVADGGVDDPLSNIWLDIETRMPASGGTPSPAPGFPRWLPYFCVPRNERLDQLRATIADRLFKIRHCQNIAGVERQLPLFEPPIDPALLVRARAAGLSLSEVLGAMSPASLSAYRFTPLYRRALEAASDVRSLGGALLSVLEKKDHESLARLRIRHESAIFDLSRSLIEDRIRDAEFAVDALRVRRTAAAQRRDFWAAREVNEAETAHRQQVQEAHYWDYVSHGFEIAASIGFAIPQTAFGASGPSFEFGGTHLGNIFRAIGGAFGYIGRQYQLEATLSSIQGSRDQRQLDWQIQTEQAALDVEEIDVQIEGAQIRLAIARGELRQHDLRARQNRDVDDFMQRKFTNEELYGWMSARLAALHHQAYRLAVDLARSAERAAQHELGDPDLRVIGFEHFDSSRRGILAGEQLSVELRRLESRYLDANTRELDLTKHVSLATIAPLELIRLRETGTCSFVLPEVLFEIDFPGHVRRRIRSVAVSIPCVAGPYATVNATLRLKESQLRAHDASMSPLESFAGRSTIATSSGQSDAGVFELTFRDERFLPFEGAGAISTWDLEIPRGLPTFDHDSISDVVLHLRYSAVEGPPEHRDGVVDTLDELVRSWLDTETTGVPMRRVLSMRREFSAELHRFLNPREEGDHQVTLSVEPRHFAHFLRDRELSLPDAGDVPVQVRVHVQAANRAHNADLSGIGAVLLRDESSAEDAFAPSSEGLAVAEFDGFTGTATAPWTLRIPRDRLTAGPLVIDDGALPRLDPDAIDDVLLELSFRPRRRL